MASGWYDEATLLARLSEQQARLVGDVLSRAAGGERRTGALRSRLRRLSRENRRLARDLEGSLDRIQEAHHRVRNHLQTVTGLLSAQEVSEQSPTARRALQQGVARLTSVAAIHDLLARDPRSGELRLPELAERLSRHLVCQAGCEERLQVRTDVAPLALSPRDATAFVLVLTELLANAIEHAFPGQGTGTITVRVMRDGDQAVLEVWDTGRGLPAGFDMERTPSLGLRLVRRLAERDLGGSATAWNERGARFRVAFPVGDMRDGQTGGSNMAGGLWR